MTSGSAGPSSENRTLCRFRVELADAGKAGEGVGRRRLGERDLHAGGGACAQALDLLDEHEAAVADKADTVGDALNLGQNVGGEERRRAAIDRLLEQAVELLLDQRIEP